MFTTWNWLTIAFARATTTSASRSLVGVRLTWNTASAPYQASCRQTSGNTPSWQIASPKRPIPSMSKQTTRRPGPRRLVRLPREALAVARDELARRREDERGVVDRIAVALVDAPRNQPQAGLARERAEPVGQRARHRDGRLLHVAVVALEQHGARHQVQLGRDDELQAVEERRRTANLLLEPGERRLRVERDRRDLQSRHEERPRAHCVES